MQQATSQLTDLLNEARLLVFDFDGTLVDSTEIKWKGFEIAFSEYSDHLNEISEYCRGFHHTPRDEKFRHVCERILGVPYTTETAAVLHARFGRATTDAIVRAPEIEGARRFLETARARYTMAVLSSTPHDVLIEILRRRGWYKFFESVQGAPVNKADWIREMRLRKSLDRHELVAFGDTWEDAEAARAAGSAFVGVANLDLQTRVSCFIGNYRGLAA